MIAKNFLSYAIMEIFAFKVGVGPKGPQQYLLGFLRLNNCRRTTAKKSVVFEVRKCSYFNLSQKPENVVPKSCCRFVMSE